MKYSILFSLLLLASGTVISQSDCKGCEDYPLLPRMPNFHIENINVMELDAEKFYFDQEFHMIEGKTITIRYRHNSYGDLEYSFPSRIQILRNYSNAIAKSGGRILFERGNSEHGFYTFVTEGLKEIWIKVAPRKLGNFYDITVIEKEAMKQDIIIDADLIKQKIELYGKVAIYGIFFDVGQSVIRAESDPSLVQMAQYLNDNPMVNCWVVGHTDADGSFEVNSKLSLDRATAIKSTLESKYNVTPNRLFAEGVGPLAPISSNATEEGKQLNRRVELVIK